MKRVLTALVFALTATALPVRVATVSAEPIKAAPEFQRENERRIELVAEDGVNLVATYYAPLSAERPNALIVLLHDEGQDRYSWLRWGRILNEHGYAVVAPDLRGFGESTTSASGKFRAIDRQGDGAFFGKAALDVKACIDFAVKQESVYPQRVAVMGAGLGANIAATAAAADSRIKVLALLGAKPVIQGLDAGKSLGMLKSTPVILFADQDGAAAANELAKSVVGKTEVHAAETVSSGIDLTRTVHAFDDHCLGFLSRVLYEQN